MTDFSKEIQNFKRYGTYVYKPDDVGNYIFNSSSVDFSKVYFAFPIENFIYNNIKIQSFYDTTFTEFIPVVKVPISQSQSQELQPETNNLLEENVNLRSQLDLLTQQINENGNVADKQATKQVILELRKALGQGRVDSDFSDDFPYAPIKKTESLVK